MSRDDSKNLWLTSLFWAFLNSSSNNNSKRIAFNNNMFCYFLAYRWYGILRQWRWRGANQRHTKLQMLQVHMPGESTRRSCYQLSNFLLNVILRDFPCCRSAGRRLQRAAPAKTGQPLTRIELRPSNLWNKIQILNKSYAEPVAEAVWCAAWATPVSSQDMCRTDAMWMWPCVAHFATPARRRPRHNIVVIPKRPKKEKYFKYLHSTDSKLRQQTKIAMPKECSERQAAGQTGHLCT